jgi:hypothetical protein
MRRVLHSIVGVLVLVGIMVAAHGCARRDCVGAGGQPVAVYGSEAGFACVGAEP